jgi:hypothetical protein
MPMLYIRFTGERPDEETLKKVLKSMGLIIPVVMDRTMCWLVPTRSHTGLTSSSVNMH